MSEQITFHLHAEKTTVVTSSHSNGGPDCEPFTTLSIGPVVIFASAALLRLIAGEATKAALRAEGWSEPSTFEVPVPLPTPSSEIPF